MSLVFFKMFGNRLIRGTVFDPQLSAFRPLGSSITCDSGLSSTTNARLIGSGSFSTPAALESIGSCPVTGVTPAAPLFRNSPYYLFVSFRDAVSSLIYSCISIILSLAACKSAVFLRRSFFRVDSSWSAALYLVQFRHPAAAGMHAVQGTLSSPSNCLTLSMQLAQLLCPCFPFSEFSELLLLFYYLAQLRCQLGRSVPFLFFFFA